MINVTLCIPLYNSESTIARTLESLLNQSLAATKIRIFDNQSTDRSVEIVRRFMKDHSNIELVINEKNIGAEGNFTRCIQAAEGDYCALVHSDDIYEPDFISTSVQALETHSDCVASFCHAREIDDQEKVLGERFYPAELSDKTLTVVNPEFFKTLIYKYGNFVTCPSVMVRAKAYAEHIRFWNGEQFKSSADLDVWMRLTQVGSLLAIKTPLINYRIAEVSHSFRIAKIRTSRHDIFTVLDFYKQPSNSDHYKFLLLKDQAIRTLNIIRTKNHSLTFPHDEPFDLFLIFEKLFESKWHFNFGIKMIGIKVVSTILALTGWNKRK